MLLLCGYYLHYTIRNIEGGISLKSCMIFIIHMKLPCFPQSHFEFVQVYLKLIHSAITDLIKVLMLGLKEKPHWIMLPEILPNIHLKIDDLLELGR